MNETKGIIERKTNTFNISKSITTQIKIERGFAFSLLTTYSFLKE